MKKTVIIILAILPIFLVITISFAGKILSYYQHISVEKVKFVDELDKEYDEMFIFNVEVGEEKQTRVRVYPDLASNKNVKYSSNDESICKVDKEGKILGVGPGTTKIKVETEEGRKTAFLKVKITQGITSLSLDKHAIELTEGETQTLSVIIEPEGVQNIKIQFKSSNESVVKVGKYDGIVTAIGEGTATITVETDDGVHSDTCVVTCKKGIPPLAFDFSNDPNFENKQDGYIVNIKEFNLLNYLQFDAGKVNIEDVRFDIIEGRNKASLDGETITIKGIGVIRIRAYVGDENSPTYQTEIKLLVNKILKT